MGWKVAAKYFAALIAPAKAARTSCAIEANLRCRGGGQEIPNHNIQAPGKLQYPNPKVRVALGLNIEF
jgi:hypothetical protein